MNIESWIYTIAFYGLAGLALLGALGVIWLKNLFHAGLSLILALFAVAGLFILLGCEFLAGVQVLIYVGAIAVLLLFAVMLTQRIAFQQILRVFSRAALVAVPVMVALFAVVMLVALKAEAPAMQAFPTESFVGPLAAALLSTYLLPFEVVSLLLLGALVGAIILARKEED